MTVVQWLTDFTACGLCMHPAAPDVETVVCVDISDRHGYCIVHADCFDFVPPPRLARVEMRVRAGIDVRKNALPQRGLTR